MNNKPYTRQKPCIGYKEGEYYCKFGFHQVNRGSFTVCSGWTKPGDIYIPECCKDEPKNEKTQ